MIKNFSIGKISKPHGVHGEVNIIPFDKDLSIFKNLESVYLGCSDIDESDLKELKIVSVKFKNNRVVIKFDEISTCNEAETLIADIKECNVYDENDFFLGKVSEVIKTKNNDVYWIKKTQLNDELLIPVFKSIVLKIDIDARKIIIREVKSWSYEN